MCQLMCIILSFMRAVKAVSTSENKFPNVKDGAMTKLGQIYYNLKEYDKSIAYWRQLESDNNLDSSDKSHVYEYLMKNYQALQDTANAEKYSQLYENNH